MQGEERPRDTWKLDRLTQDEEAVMDAIWEAGVAVTPEEIRERINRGGKQPWAKTKVRGCLYHLVWKRYVFTEPYPNRPMPYLAIVSRAEYRHRLLGELIDTWYGGDAGNLLLDLLGWKDRERGGRRNGEEPGV